MGQIGVWQIGEDEILREFGSERDFIEGEEREKERIRDRESLEFRVWV